jgi:hypothetical protein
VSGLETAIRQALERADRTSPEMRARIYQSARNALEAGLRKQDVHDADVVAQQRHRLEVLIHSIENEERASLKLQTQTEVAVEAAETTVQADERPVSSIDDSLDIAPGRDPSPVPPPRAARLGDGRPPGAAEPRGTEQPSNAGPQLATDEMAVQPLRAEPSLDGAKRGRASKKQEMPKKRRRRGRFFSFLMVLTVLGAAFGTAAWWVKSSGLLQTAAERDTGVANPPAKVNSEDFNGLPTLGAQSGFNSDWVDIYKPGAGENPTTGPQAAADLITDEGGQHLKIASSSADAGGDVHIQIPAAVLEQLSGKTSTLALTVQADMGKTTQFSVECDFSTLGECGRHRFTLNDEKIDMLFKVTFDRSLAPSEPGNLIISSDVTGAGASLNLYAVRILPGQ